MASKFKFIQFSALLLTLVVTSSLNSSFARADSFKFSEITCWEISTLEDSDRASALLLIYGFVAGQHNLDAHSGSSIGEAIETTRNQCAESPDVTVVTVMSTSLMPSQTAMSLKALDVGDIVDPVETRRIQESMTFENPFALTPHKPNYILPATAIDSRDFAQYGPFQPF